MTLTFGSLFSGIGGFDLGFERAGMKCAWQCEIDKKASEVLAHHWPEVERYEDVRTIGKANAEPVDLICGGFPCQDLSVAGKRKGLAGDRSGLWFEFHRILSELRPQWVVIENVPGLLSSNRGGDFAVLLSGLADIGYLSAWRVLDAQYFGVAQRRRRVFIVASLGNGRAAEVLFEREGVRWNPPTRGEAGQGLTVEVAASLRHGGGEGRGYNLDAECGLVTGTVSSIETRCYKGINADNLDHMIASPIMSRIGKGAFTDPVNDNVICWEMQHASEAYREAGDIAPNLQARMGTGGNNVPLVGVRRLTPTECARLQGFPDDWNGWLADASRYKQFGNAVCVNVAEWIGKRIVEVQP